MEITELTVREYDLMPKTICSAFDTSNFCELNRSKVDSLVYLSFNDGKNRFVLPAGIKNNIVKFPFSASFAMLNEVTKHNKILQFHEAVKALNLWALSNKYCRVVFSLPPYFYRPDEITMLTNALLQNGYTLDAYEVNYEYYLSNFNEPYEMTIDPKARQKLRAAVKNGLTFEKTEDLPLVYEIIRKNRAYRGFPLWLNLEDVQATKKVIDIDLFLVRDAKNVPAASALIYHLTEEILRVVYWGNTPESEELRPMNYLAYQVFKYYSNSKFRIVDIGHSTDGGIPNFGLCDFKQSIGCSCSPKCVYSKNF